jgi:pimeloyl-ACP methyl ester carboxylesterase
MTTTDVRSDASFDPVMAEHVDEAGRRFGYATVTPPGAAGLGIHFSAFFGNWGNARAYRDTFKGYFHRLRMLGTHERRNWLFLCDPYGAFDNGTYYLGEGGDCFVERAMHEIIDRRLDDVGITPDRMVTIGSSMGGTAALKFGARYDAAGIVAIGPHIDLDTSAVHQNRMAEVAFALDGGDVTAVHNRVLTRQIRNELAARSRPPPPVFVQSCRDDLGVHEEQVLPLCSAWTEAAGMVHLDERPSGGHTSDHAPRALLIDVVDRLLDGAPIDVARYQHDGAFAGATTPVPWSHRIRSRLRLRSRLRAIAPGARA